jgi:anionic cell wall polymer biosynthesis LytR-Cps2A-Psr (LCP) family protein
MLLLFFFLFFYFLIAMILAEGLKSFFVTSYKEIEEKINEGTTNRSIAATNMNETSSRAHTIVVINLIQKSKNASGQETTKTSSINLVDLAGRYLYQKINCVQNLCKSN